MSGQESWQMLQMFAKKAEERVQEAGDNEILASEFHKIMSDCVDAVRIKKETGFAVTSLPASLEKAISPVANVAVSGSGSSSTAPARGGKGSGTTSTAAPRHPTARPHDARVAAASSGGELWDVSTAASATAG